MDLSVLVALALHNPSVVNYGVGNVMNEAN